MHNCRGPPKNSKHLRVDALVRIAPVRLLNELLSGVAISADFHSKADSDAEIVA